MKAHWRPIISFLLIFGMITLPCGISMIDEARAQDDAAAIAAGTAALPALVDEHIRYMAGYADGTMHPDSQVTRAEAAAFLYRLLADRDSGTAACRFTDVQNDDWFEEPVRAIRRLGFVADTETFRPNDPITRAEFVAIIEKLVPDRDVEIDFSDVPADHWAAEAIAKAFSLGWVSGYPDGSFGPDNTLTRAEACAIFNRVAGRDGNDSEARTLLTLGLYDDVPADHWAGRDIVEASIAHTTGDSFLVETLEDIDFDACTFTPGVHLIDGRVFAVSRDGKLLHDQAVGAYWATSGGELVQVQDHFQADVPYISQLDEIEAISGCEPISALMGLKSKGFLTAPSAADFLEGLPYAESDPADGFVGSPYVSDGRYHSIDPVPLAAYCNAVTGTAACADISGASVDVLRRELLAGNFIVAWQTFYWAPVRYEAFYINGEPQQMAANNHVRLICGYDPVKGYYVSDPYNEYNPGETYQYWIDDNAFEALWNERRTGMVIR